ncbi:MAG: (2Fe-2S)-binding protein [candidate division WOR-3 bacterium]
MRLNMPRKSSENQSSRITDHPILSFSRGQKVTFYFEGRPMSGYLGETIAAALVANGVKVFRYTEKHQRARGFFCAVGKCSSCLMVVDGVPNTMVCMEPLRAGVRVERQHGRGKL